MANNDDEDRGMRAWAEQGAAEELFNSLPPEETALAPIGGMDKVSAALADFERISACLTELKARFPADLVYDVTTKEGMASAVAHRAAWRDPRVKVEKLRVAAKEPVLALGRDIDARAKWLTAQLEAGEAPVAAQIKAENDRKAAEKQARIDAEFARVEAIQTAMHELHMEGEVSRAESSADIARRLEDVRGRVLDQSTFQEQMLQAEAARALVVSKLATALDARKFAEAEAARMAAERAELEELRRQDAERKRKEAAEAAAKKAEDDAEAKAEAGKLAEERRQLDADRAALAQQQAVIEAQRAPAAAVITPPPAPAEPPAAEEAPSLKLGDINALFEFTMNAEFVTQTLKVPKRNDGGKAVLFYASDLARIGHALVAHVQRKLAEQANKG